MGFAPDPEHTAAQTQRHPAGDHRCRRADKPGGDQRGDPPFGVAYTDFTELAYADGRRKAQLIPIVDHASKLALGWAVGERAVTGLALEAWERAR